MHRGRGLMLCLSGKRRQVPAAVTLMDAMGGSNEERQALNTALADSDPALSLAAAIALARQHVVDPAVVTRLAAALAATPERTVFAIGTTGLSGSAPRRQPQGADSAAEGPPRAQGPAPQGG